MVGYPALGKEYFFLVSWMKIEVVFVVRGLLIVQKCPLISPLIGHCGKSVEVVVPLCFCCPAYVCLGLGLVRSVSAFPILVARGRTLQMTREIE